MPDLTFIAAVYKQRDVRCTIFAVCSVLLYGLFQTLCVRLLNQ